jgi:hypothetical protein
VTRRAWTWVASGYALMAAGFLVVLFILNNHIQTVQATQRAAATVAVHNAGAICLGLTAPTKQEEGAIVEAFLRGDGTIVEQFTPVCARAAYRAATDIFGVSGVPAGLRAELEARGG